MFRGWWYYFSAGKFSMFASELLLTATGKLKKITAKVDNC
jgi:hypothetical protein